MAQGTYIRRLAMRPTTEPAPTAPGPAEADAVAPRAPDPAETAPVEAAAPAEPGATAPVEESEPAAPSEATNATPAEVAASPAPVGGQDGQAAPRAVGASVSLLASLGPIFMAALLYPGVEAPAGAWAGAVRRMSEVSTKLTDQLAQMQRDEIDIAWARRELHPAVVKMVAQFWMAAVLRPEGIRSVEDVPLRPEEMLPGLVAAERALQGYAHAHEPIAFPVEVELLPALAGITVNAQTYANMLRAKAGVDLSLDAYLTGVSDALLGAIARGAERAAMPGLDRQAFSIALLSASTGIVVKACEVAINEVLQQLADAAKTGTAAPALPESGFPVGRTAQLIEAGVGRLAGTYAYIAKQLGAVSD